MLLINQFETLSADFLIHIKPLNLHTYPRIRGGDADLLRCNLHIAIVIHFCGYFYEI